MRGKSVFCKYKYRSGCRMDNENNRSNNHPKHHSSFRVATFDHYISQRRNMASYVIVGASRGLGVSPAGSLAATEIRNTD